MNYIYKVAPKTLIRSTYDAKEQLKECGCRYDAVLGWYAKDKVNVPKDFTLIPLDYNRLYNKDHLMIEGGAEYLVETLNSVNTIEVKSEQYGEVQTRYHNMKCLVLSKKAMSTRYGIKFQYLFKYNGNHVFEWISAVDYEVTPDSVVNLTGTVKGFVNNHGAKVTQLTRCKLEVTMLAVQTKKLDGFEWG